ncbi:MAG: class I SAM-dependent methyltransferase family protein [Candidatus Micrarchaeota archaeon]|nr:class I SAM-dependent methyltransferase family protein [Candidatus Micrarchaeota archaeon]
MVKAIRVPRKKGEEMRRRLSSSGILDEEHFPSHDEKYVYLPVKKSVPRYKLVEVEARRREVRKGFGEMLSEIVGGETEGIFSSYDIVGDIAVLGIPDDLRAKEKEIADALLRTNANIKAVLRKESGMEGEYRVRRFSFLAGEKRTEATYVEHGVRMRLDLAKVYFSPRLSHERGRIAEQVRAGEKVLVMFAGVGPFALVIAKKQKDAKVYGIELNPDAVRYFEENVKLNGMEGRVEAILGDVRKVVPKRFVGVADRVLMPLPKSAEDFLDVALLAAKKGGVIHFYTFVNRAEGKEAAEKKVFEAGRRAGRTIQILESREVRPFSPSTVQIVVDFRAS